MTHRGNLRNSGYAQNSDWLWRLWVVCFGYNFIFPHSIQEVCTAVLIIPCFFSFFRLDRYTIKSIYGLMVAFFIASIVHIIYLILGQSNHRNIEYSLLNFVLYIVTPFIWLLSLSTIISVYGVEKIIQLITFLLVLSTISVALYFYLFSYFGPESVRFFIAEGNVLIEDGRASAALAVYATFIFTTSAYFSTPDAVRSTSMRFLILTLLSAVILTSGRTALFAAAGIGLGLAIFFAFMNAVHRRGSRQPSRIASWSLAAIAAATVIILIDVQLEQIDLASTLSGYTDEILSGGGSERNDQFLALIEGIKANNGLGAGHGVGVAIVRDFNYTWRYEVFVLGFVYRLGLIGAMIVLAPFGVYVAMFLRDVFSGQVHWTDQFLFSGFVGASFAALTNPYPESFIYQWFYILPMTAYFMRRFRNRRPH